MKFLNALALVLVLGFFTACGSNNSSSNGVAVNPYATTVPGTGYGTQTGYGQTGYNSYGIPGGTKTLTPILVGTVSSYGTKVYSVSQNVAAGDQIIVSASGSVMYAMGTILGGIGGTSSSGYLQGLTVSVAGQTLGTSLYVTYNVPAAGNLSIEGIASILNIAHTDKTNFVTTFYGGVYLAHCVSTAGAAMTCP